ncbi:type II secretion system F family protein [Arsenicicoccus sp. oral taxon 190]|uniref:type II secretion system F family protein n=1 Tax=Arsenicicoccus sp. oral taxon 190 TaxID=1658671 RepID=UPI00067A068D|nr:type II secretion system F family protein [Arsenicicoccus sp. oral taxon 190]AKT51450.1 pilus assembly protein TadB [Arsenicicoccus sp. oral taxon 190]
MNLASSWSWPGAVLGLAWACGLLLVWHRLPVRRRPTLADRISPYLQDVQLPSTARAVTPSDSGLADLLRPLLVRLGSRLDRALGGQESVRRRLLRAGAPADVEGFRAEQVLWGAGGAALGGALAVVAVARDRGAVMPAVVLVAVAAMSGVVLRDHWLTRGVRRREQRILQEFPTVAELLALSVTAGEGAAGALDRVCRLSGGDLAHELRLCLAEARAGLSLPAALQTLADRTGLPGLARFVDGIVIAVERGTPLAEVMRAQAQDVREQGRRAVMEEGGRREIAMMIPVVFLILPVTVLFAVFPGLQLLTLTV